MTRGFFKRMLPQMKKGQGGFTLVELLVVVGIIVALAAVSFVSVTQFAGRGEQGAQAAELDNVQAAFDAMMADVGITTVTANAAPSNSTNSFALVPTEGPLAGYLRTDPTTRFYCWDTSGKITLQSDTAAACP
ncbi:MAG: prepilin-type N-terminal cleavage/methylation domain-containing protein [Chloroflexi bacterium]|nr:prepilin-type N-terminal cleavage/methylation domain-containing protein [Chloroflexota bacterium]